MGKIILVIIHLKNSEIKTMDRQKRIEEKLSVLKPEYLEVINDSPLHDGHTQSSNDGQSHFTVKIKAESIASEALLEQHRIINNLLKDEFNSGLHALSIKITKP